MNANEIVGKRNIIMLTLDTLRYDVAQRLWESGETPNFKKLLPNGWEKRHTPGSFTYAAHHAFFAGFFPTPVSSPKAPRLFATRFAGSETSTDETFLFDSPTIIEGLQEEGYRTACIGGVGFFNRQTPLSNVFPSLFMQSHWSPELGVTAIHSTKNQFEKARDILLSPAQEERHKNVFLFINVSAIHQPNCFYLEGAEKDSIESHAAALKYVDSQLPILMEAVKELGPSCWLMMGDHGTAYGEDGYEGHRLAHEVVWTVPYAEILND
ncbi:STM4013/SEN3800 family hydrolase [Limibacter armeniacum]|uniref:STM4013/SEN3800 family hydrolase n=1 Tax=Limibacter armeniacum TaxID=466084 RepID=UPI002FE5D3E0